jgi:hypothetical protein
MNTQKPFLVAFACLLCIVSPFSAIAETSPEPPINIKIFAGDGKAVISWTEATDGSRYDLYWATEPSISAATATKINGVRPPYVHRGLKNFTTYYYIITKVLNNVESKPSEVFFITPPAPDAIHV